MIVIFIAAFFCVLNICLWAAFFLKFKKLFSTDDIIASTREEMERMIADINKNAGRNLDLIEDRIRQLKAVVAEADRHVETSRRELENQKSVISYQKKIDSAHAAQQYMRNKNMSISAGLQSQNSYELTDEGNRYVNSHPADLFEQADAEEERRNLQKKSNRIISDNGTAFTVETDGSSYASVPVIGGNVSFADEPVQPKMKISELIYNLYSAGHSIEEIARDVNTSTTEVQMVLEINYGISF